MVKNISSSSASLPLSAVIDRINTEKNFAEFDFLFNDNPPERRRNTIIHLLDYLDITEENYDRNLVITYSSTLCFTNEIKQWATDNVDFCSIQACSESDHFAKFEMLFLNDFGSQHLSNTFKFGGVNLVTIQVQATAYRYFANKVLRLISDQGGL